MDFRFNKNAHLVGYYATLPAANDALVFIPLEATGLPTDAVLKDCDDLAAVFAAGAVEQTTMGRQTVTASTATVDDANDVTDIDVADPVWAAAGGNPTGKLLVAYDPDTTTGTDADLVLLSAHDFAAEPDGVADLTGVVFANGIYRLS